MTHSEAKDAEPCPVNSEADTLRRGRIASLLFSAFSAEILAAEEPHVHAKGTANEHSFATPIATPEELKELFAAGGSFTMLGGSITGNKTPYSNDPGGGVAGYGEITVGGTALIKGNFRAEIIPDDLYVGNPTSHPLIIAAGENAPKEGMELAISLYRNSDKLDCGVFSAECADCTAYLFPSDPSLSLIYASGVMALTRKETSAGIKDGKLTVQYTALTKDKLSFFVALYDENGRMLGVGTAEATPLLGGNTVEIVLPEVAGAPASYKLMTASSAGYIPIGEALVLTAATNLPESKK